MRQRVLLSEPADEAGAERLYGLLRDGRAEEATELLMSLYRCGLGVAEIVDGPIRGAMHRIGELWLCEPTGIMREHRATQILIQAVSRLRAALPARHTKVCAVGCAPAGDCYHVPTLCAATVLEASGFNTVNLGPETPISTLRDAAHTCDAVLAWLSVSLAPKPEQLAAEIEALHEELAARDVPLMIGGRASDALQIAPDATLRRGSCMGDLRALAEGLCPPTARC